MKRLAAVFGSRHRSGHSDIASSQHDDASTANDDNTHDSPYPPKQPHLPRPKSSFFRSLSRRVQPPAGQLNTSDGGHVSSSSSSSAGPSTPDDDARSFVRAKTWLFHPDAAPPTQTAVHVQASLIVPTAARIGSIHSARIGLTPGRPNAQVEHDSDDESSASEFSRSSAHTPTVLSPSTRVPQRAMMTQTPATTPSRPLSAVEYAKVLANNGLTHSFSPPPLLHIANSPLFPRSCNGHSQLSASASDSLRTQLFQTRVLARLARPSRADERVLQPFAGKHRPQLKGPQLRLDDNAVSGRPCSRSEGLQRWADRPCFEDRLVVYRPAEEGEECEPDTEGIVCVPVSGSLLGVAALEFSEHLENLAGLYDDLTEDLTVTADTETDAATEITFTLTSIPKVELPETQDIPARVEFPRSPSQGAHAAPALNVDVDVGGLGELIEFERKLSTDSSPPLPTPPLSSSTSPSTTSSGPPTPTGTMSAGVTAGNVFDVKDGVKADAGSRTPTSSPQHPSGILSSPQQRQQPYKATPSPLRMESNMLPPNAHSSAKPSSISGSSTKSVSPTPSTTTSTATVTLQTVASRQPQTQKPSPRLAVRFAESTKGKDKDSDTEESEEASENERPKRKDIPLNYVQRIRQQRLEKQRFLAAERARRAQAEEAQRRAKAQEEERIRAERRREEEERRRRMYQEEVAAARSRRESTKFVQPQLSMSGSATEVNIGAGAAAMVGRGREREKAESYARPMYDQRRGSESSQARSSISRTRDGSREPLPVPSLPLSPNVRNASPAPSGSASASASQRDSSAHSHLAPPHPAALVAGNRSSSAPDVRPRDRSASSSRGTGNRSSIAESVGGRDRTSSNPSPSVPSPSQMWMASPMMGMPPNMNMNMNMNRMSMMAMPMMAMPMAVPVAVPVQGYPMSPMQMSMEPLLPPTPPFVMQQFGYRPPSQNSHRDSSPSSAQRRSHSSSPAPPSSDHHGRERSESRSSSSPVAARQQKDSFPPSSGRSAVRASQHYPPPSPSSSPSRQQDYSHHRRSSGDMDLHRRSNLQAPPMTLTRSDRGEPGRDCDGRRASKPPPVPSPRSGRPQAHHTSSMPSPASPAIVVDRTSRPVSGFQILSRPSQQRRQTMIS